MKPTKQNLVNPNEITLADPNSSNCATKNGYKKSCKPTIIKNCFGDWAERGITVRLF